MKLNNLQVIVFNYITCVVTGSFVNGGFPVTASNMQTNWFPWACLMGVLFISLFNIIAYTAQKAGVAVASVANKLSLVIPFLFSIYLYREAASWLKLAGIAVALTAVVMTCWPGRSDISGKHRNQSILLMPVILFIGSGLLDTLIKYVEHSFLNGDNNNDFLVSAFASAATIGVLLVSVQLARGRQAISGKAVLMGVCLGIPNYFSIWCLVRVLKNYASNSSAIIPINNMGIVLFSTLVAWVLFKEKLSFINWVGVLLAVGAIALIAYG